MLFKKIKILSLWENNKMKASIECSNKIIRRIHYYVINTILAFEKIPKLVNILLSCDSFNNFE